MKNVIQVSMLLLLLIGFTHDQRVQGQGLLPRENYVSTLSFSLGNDQTLALGNQYMNDFEVALVELASEGDAVTKEQVLELVYRLSNDYPGGIDHSTEMSLTMYGQDYLTQTESTQVLESNASPFQALIGHYQSTQAVASIALEDVSLSVSDYNRKTEEHLVWYLSNRVTGSESFKADATHHLTFNSDGSARHEGTEGYGYEEYTYHGMTGDMTKLGPNRYFYYNDVQNSYDLVFFKQLENNSVGEMVFNVDLTRFSRIHEETTSQSSTYRSVVQLHQAFEAYYWITSPEALSAYQNFEQVIEHASFGNGGTNAKMEELMSMVNRSNFTLSDNIQVDHRTNNILSYPYTRQGGTSAFMQVSYPIYDYFAMGGTLMFYEVTTDMFKPVTLDFYQYNSVSEFVAINPNIIAVSQYWGTPEDIYQLVIPTINPSTGVEEVSFILYDTGQLFHYQSIPYSSYKDSPAKTNYQVFHDYYLEFKN